jgi:hypothetical protein
MAEVTGNSVYFDREGTYIGKEANGYFEVEVMSDLGDHALQVGVAASNAADWNFLGHDTYGVGYSMGGIVITGGNVIDRINTYEVGDRVGVWCKGKSATVYLNGKKMFSQLLEWNPHIALGAEGGGKCGADIFTKSKDMKFKPKGAYPVDKTLWEKVLCWLGV